MPITSRAAIHLLVVASMLANASAQPASSDTERSYRTATGLLNRGMNDLAAQEYQTFLSANPSSPKAPKARYGLAVCLVKLGKHAEAIAQLDQIAGLKDFEFAADACMLRAQCSMATADFKAAAVQLEQLIRDFPQAASLDAATALLGEAHYTAGDVQAARTTLQQALTRFPASRFNERVEYLLALCEAAMGDDAAAAERLARWRTSFPSSPLAAHATLVEARCQHRAGDAVAAERLYTTASTCGDAAIEAQALMGIAQVLRAKGSPRQARETLEALALGNPQLASIAPFAIELARCAIDEGNYTRALEVLQSVDSVQASQRADELAFWMARCQLKLNRPTQAEAILRKAAAAFPQSALRADLLLEQGAALTAMGDHERAAQLYESAAAGEAPVALKAKARLSQASALHLAGNYQQSLDLCNDLLPTINQAWAKADVHLLAAENHYLLRAYEKAQVAYGAFLNQSPTHQHAWRAGVRRGLCLAQLQRAQEASAVLLPLVEQAGSNDPALVRAACTCMGELAFTNSNWPQAEQWLSRAVQDGGPEADPSRLKLGLALMRESKREEAIRIFEAIEVSATPSDTALQATFERGQALVELNRPAEAKRAFERTLEMEAAAASPRFKQHALRHLAAIASAQGRSADAAAYLEQIATATPGTQGASDAALDRVSLLLGQGEYTKAAAACATFIKANPTHPRLSQARTQHAIAVSRMGKLEEALKAFDALASDQSSLDPALAAAAAYERAWALSQTKRPKEAAAAYAALLNSKPESRIEAHAAFDLAQLKIAAGDFISAIPLLEQARHAAQSSDANATLVPLAARCTYLRGVCQLRAGQPADAAKTLAEFETAFPGSDLLDTAAVTLGEALLASGQAAQAVKVLSVVAERASQPPLHAAALLRLGEAAAAASDWPASERAFAKHRQLFEDSDQWFRAAFGLGFALENGGKRDAAIAAYRTVIANHDGPTAARAQFQIGECLYGLGRLDEAVAELLKVDILYQYPQWSAPALYEAGRCLVEQKKHAQGLAQFEQVTSRFPESQWAKAASDAAAAARPSALPGRDTSPSTRPAPSGSSK